MIGDIEDPDFEAHLEQGPYIVFDDAARDRYKNDPRVTFVGGHPVLRDAMQGLIKGFGMEANIAGNAIMKAQQINRWGKHNLEYGTTARRVKTLA